MIPGKKCYGVSEITTLIREMLEDEFTGISVEGEISNFRPSSTGHFYFSLKDEHALISVVMFKGRTGRLNFKPTDGLKVRAEGNLSVYAKRGVYQLICEHMVPAGEGELLAQLEQLKKELAAIGVFDEERKKPLPLFPTRIAVVTSPTGAALRDILRVLKNRNAGIDLVILPAPVQGAEAALIIAKQIRKANRYRLGEVLIVGRGGGSLEDLLPFYDRDVVMAIADSEIPVISAVGHEIDVTLSDLAADRRASTPSAAAEMVSASQTELLQRVQALESSLTAWVQGRLERIGLMVSQFSSENLRHTFEQIIQPFLLDLDTARETLVSEMNTLLVDTHHRLDLLHQMCRSHSPLDVLQRGYAVVVHQTTQKALTSSAEVAVHDALDIRFYRGGVKAEVTEKSS
jgi:exodeoxyribonuclease VII large subunit